MEFLIVQNPAFAIIIGVSMMENLGKSVDIKRRIAWLENKGQRVKMKMVLDDNVAEERSTDSEDCTFGEKELSDAKDCVAPEDLVLAVRTEAKEPETKFTSKAELLATNLAWLNDSTKKV